MQFALALCLDLICIWKKVVQWISGITRKSDQIKSLVLIRCIYSYALYIHTDTQLYVPSKSSFTLLSSFTIILPSLGPTKWTYSIFPTGLQWRNMRKLDCHWPGHHFQSFFGFFFEECISPEKKTSHRRQISYTAQQYFQILHLFEFGFKRLRNTGAPLFGSSVTF